MATQTSRHSARLLCYSALMCALIIVSTLWIRFPIPGTDVMFTTQVFFVLLCGQLLPPRYCLYTLLLYVGMGLAGVPVFSSICGPAVLSTPSFINSWNQFMFPLVLTSQEESFTLPLALNYFTAAFRFDYPALFAALTITVLPTIITFFLMSDRIIAGMAGGAIKG